nr:hypothetical protein CFP56_16413 [Quercus suber]
MVINLPSTSFTSNEAHRAPIILVIDLKVLIPTSRSSCLLRNPLEMTNVNKEYLSFKLTIHYKKFLINPKTVVEALHIPRVPIVDYPYPSEFIFDTNELNSRPCGHTTWWIYFPTTSTSLFTDEKSKTYRALTVAKHFRTDDPALEEEAEMLAAGKATCCC